MTVLTTNSLLFETHSSVTLIEINFSIIWRNPPFHSGPLIAIIVERIGSRPTAMIGCGGLGLSLCTMSFTTNFTTFFIAYGILACKYWAVKKSGQRSHNAGCLNWINSSSSCSGQEFHVIITHSSVDKLNLHTNPFFQIMCLCLFSWSEWNVQEILHEWDHNLWRRNWLEYF